MVTNIGDLPSVAANAVGGAKSGNGGTDFADFMKEAGSAALDTLQRGENLSKQGLTGQADLTDVVAAVNEAELTLKTVTSLRDKMVQAFQEISRMPI